MEPSAPSLVLTHVKYLDIFLPSIVNVKVTFPFKTLVPPNVASFATFNMINPSVSGVDAVLEPNVTPSGNRPTDTEQSTLLNPLYPVNGISIKKFSKTNPSFEQGIF